MMERRTKEKRVETRGKGRKGAIRRKQEEMKDMREDGI